MSAEPAQVGPPGLRRRLSGSLGGPGRRARARSRVQRLGQRACSPSLAGVMQLALTSSATHLQPAPLPPLPLTRSAPSSLLAPEDIQFFCSCAGERTTNGQVTFNLCAPIITWLCCGPRINVFSLKIMVCYEMQL